MLKTLLQTLGGIVLFLGGILLIYFFIISLNTHANILFFILSLLCIGGGVFLFIKAGKSDSTVTAKLPPMKATPGEGDNLSDRLAKNNALLGDWGKTNDTKNRLRMMEAGSSESSQ